ncbi:hypothetical protein HPB48_011145 [Haemaphysalis longicornis]|uniref:Integrase zinc-binding domain-containing protein n=1 Tax=Haemaphysalis longicornis TaxID=44386 RepID=A0A9J6FY80_HAELO|nr:hypothetical protein HPB48_011145 [Haemaphysalis longicornis]
MAMKFRTEQQIDTTLQTVSANAKRVNGWIGVVSGILYARYKLLGQRMRQRVLPESRRSARPQKAHQSIVAGQLGLRKMKAHIKYCFFSRATEEGLGHYCAGCHACQTRSHLRTANRLPIEPLASPGYPFKSVNIDVIALGSHVQVKGTNIERFIWAHGGPGECVSVL